MKLGDVKLGSKLYGMLGMLLIMMAMIAGVGLIKANDFAQKLYGLVEGEFAAMEELEHSRGLMLEARMAYYRAISSSSLERREKLRTEGASAFNQAIEHLKKLDDFGKTHGVGAETTALLDTW